MKLEALHLALPIFFSSKLKNPQTSGTDWTMKSHSFSLVSCFAFPIFTLLAWFQQELCDNFTPENASKKLMVDNIVSKNVPEVLFHFCTRDQRQLSDSVDSHDPCAAVNRPASME